MKKLIYCLIIIFIIFSFLKINNYNSKKTATDTINTYYLLYQEKNFDDAMKLLYIPKEIEELRDIHYQAIQEIDLKHFSINSVNKYNKKLYGFDINIKEQYGDDIIEQNITQYVANIDDKWYVVINQDFLPKEILTDNVPSKRIDDNTISPFDFFE